MRALYSCCIADPFISVAKELYQRIGLEPVYWIGDIYSSSFKSTDEHSVKEAFPGIIFHRFIDAWKGIFPSDIEKIWFNYNIDIDLLRKLSSEELQAFSMMDRLDYDRKSFNLMERERFFLLLIKKWSACLDLYKPDVVISAVNPHRVFDYVLYLLCKNRNIKFISYQYTMVVGRIYPLNYFSDSDVLNILFDKEYSENMKKELSLNDLPEDIKNNYLKLQDNYQTARPAYMFQHDVDDVKFRNMFFLIPRFLKFNKLFGKHGFLLDGKTDVVFKNANYQIEKSKFSAREWYKKRKERLKYNKLMYKYYSDIAKKVNLDVPYVAFFLHYQPEETTSPDGDIFVNQSLCIETLLKNTPSHVLIYVKEHPNQFMSHMLGHTRRIKDFYDDMLINPRIRFVPLECDSFSIISNALAVSTVTGTVGWEAAVRKKPVIIFGRVWFERMKGILKITDAASASLIYDFITNYKYDEQSLFAYLYTVSKHSILAYHYEGYKDKTGFSEDDTVRNLSDSLTPLIQDDGTPIG